MIKQQGLLLLFAALFAGAANPVSAGIIFDDHFDGSGGGVPPGWAGLGFNDGSGTIQDLAGSIVRVTDPAGGGPMVFQNNTAFDPSSGVTYTGKINSLSGDSTFFGIGNNLKTNAQPRLLFEVQSGTSLFVSATNSSDTTDTIDLSGTLNLASDVIFTLDTGAAGGRYRVQNGAFDSGFRNFTDDFATSGVTLATFGSSTNAVFGVSGNGSTTIADYDQLIVSATRRPQPSPNPPASPSWALQVSLLSAGDEDEKQRSKRSNRPTHTTRAASVGLFSCAYLTGVERTGLSPQRRWFGRPKTN